MRSSCLLAVSCLLVSCVYSAESDADTFKKLTDPDEKVREAAAAALEKSNYIPNEYISTLAKALQDKNPKVRKYAITTIAQLQMQAAHALDKLLPEDRAVLAEFYKDGMRRAAERDPELKKSLGEGRLAAHGKAAAANCKAYADAQQIFSRIDHDGDGVREFAQNIQGANSLSTAGASDLELVDKTFAAAAAAELGKDKAKPKAGYFFKILKAQGKDAKGGARSFIVKDNMTLGFALLAYPAVYNETGKESFMISHDGIVFKKDLGEETEKIATEMTEFNPDKSWATME